MNVNKGRYMKKIQFTATDTRVPVNGNGVCSKCRGKGYINELIGFVTLRTKCSKCRGTV